MKTKKILPLILLPMLVFCFLSASLFTVAQVDTSILTMQGKDWQIKIDQALQTETVTTSPYVIVAKQGQEKELFLQINSLEECASGSIEFKMDISGLTFYKQLPLDKELMLGEQYDFINATHAMLKNQVVVHRPQNVVNSFAGFDSEGRKQTHIYASKITDAKGQEIWLDSDLTQGLLTVYLPEQKTLESLSYPLLLDPTFGYTSIGGSTKAANSGNVVYTNATLSDDNAHITVISAYLSASSTACIAGLYSNSGSAIADNLLDTSSNTPTISTAGWYNFTMDVEVDAGTYWFALGEQGITIYYDSDANYQTRYEAFTYPNLPSTATSIFWEANRHVSIYADYHIEAEATPTPTPSPSPPPVSQETDSTLNLVILLICLGIGILLSGWSRIALVNFVFGMFMIGIASYSLTINLYAGGLLQLVVIVIGVICMYSGYREAV